MVRDIMPWRKRHEGGKGGTALSRRQPDSLWALHRQMDELFGDFFGDFEEFLPAPWMKRFGPAESFTSPRLEVSETDTEYTVSAELPGLDEKDVEVNLDGQVLTISGTKTEEREDKKKDFLVRERSYGSFHRSVQLPEGLDLEHPKAGFKKGVLTVTLARTEEARAKARKIQVSAEE